MPEQAPLTVSALTQRIKMSLEHAFPSLAIVGELSNVKLHSSGHLYFTLKDEGAQLSGVMWRSRVPTLKFRPADGLKVVVQGRITVYEVRGAYQIDVTSMRTLGAGDLQQAFEELKRKLMEEGLFAAERKRPLPPYPEKIGLITSPTGAVLHDMLHVFRRRYPVASLVFRPTRVQGAGAAQDIADAIAEMNRYGEPDVIIVARGGGSLEDLWPFNEEIVARAIAASKIPVVSGVGHEVDFTIADFVADLRAPTPTAAAELSVPDRRALIELLENSRDTMSSALEKRIALHRRSIQHMLKSHALNRPVDLLARHSQHLDELDRSMSTSLSHLFQLTAASARGLTERLNSLDPRRVLKRGYAIVRKDGRITGKRKGIAVRDTVEIEFSDGNVRSTITEI
jgi:exodeoxyribonuclease VII large subunit